MQAAAFKYGAGPRLRPPDSCQNRALVFWWNNAADSAIESIYHRKPFLAGYCRKRLFDRSVCHIENYVEVWFIGSETGNRASEELCCRVMPGRLIQPDAVPTNIRDITARCRLTSEKAL